MDPSNFYTGIVAELYEQLKSTNHSYEPSADLITRTGEPALELGSGDGEPILDLRRRGFDVDGVDSSADMLARCARRAADEGLDVTLFQQRMEEMELPRKYQSFSWQARRSRCFQTTRPRCSR
ncbi:class I SAM-dependent methyltransferase [Paenarthrobacter sp. PH39-S1]|uniref:class I SAM-dependent methyltransferase n=1 Tax=Paenarthrobacter sp. PH39-S1 TaxID=3046204 RepID=UPI0024B9D1F7|nr:class I SAM-dependent methyltransferase [Paenarthrobacter sp. PH39-S1]MDJ0358451.1 class I SAM-dependent methyltransferase [Paenarthrobacter sp. PH39-S1]